MSKVKPWQEEFDPRTHVTTYHGWSGEEYVVQVNCVLPIIGLGIKQMMVLPFGMHNNKAALDKCIEIAKDRLLADAVKQMAWAFEERNKS